MGFIFSLIWEVINLFETTKVKLQKLDWHKWKRNTLVFVSPLAVLYLVFVIGNIRTDGFSWNDFVIDDVVLGAMVLYVLNVVLDFFKKYRAVK